MNSIIRVLLILLFILPIVIGSISFHEVSFVRNYYFPLVSSGGKGGPIVYCGGSHISPCVSESLSKCLISYDDGFSWNNTEILNSPPSPRHAAPMLIINNNFTLVFGGTTACTALYNDIWKLSLYPVPEWSLLLSSSPWSPRADHSVVQLSSNIGSETRLILMGGRTQLHNMIPVNDIWESFDYGEHWQLITSSAPWSPRYLAAVSTIDSDTRIVLAGGSSLWPYKSICNDIWISDTNVMNWKSLPTPYNSYSRITNLITVREVLYLIGGYDGSRYYNDIYQSDTSGNYWQLSTDNAGYQPRAYSNIIVQGFSVLIFGGFTDYPPQSVFNDVQIAYFD